MPTSRWYFHTAPGALRHTLYTGDRRRRAGEFGVRREIVITWMRYAASFEASAAASSSFRSFGGAPLFGSARFLL